MAAETNGTSHIGDGPNVINTSSELEIHCGPLLNYKHTSGATSDSPVWHGSVLLVTSPGQRSPLLTLRCAGATSSDKSIDGKTSWDTQQLQATKLFEDADKAFWRTLIEVPFMSKEARWEYTVQQARFVSDNSPPSSYSFVVPSKIQSMRILFHSCNGFSVGTDVDAWSGPALWNDVLRFHEQQPFHVMIGGGDQIYNDSVRVDGPLKPWTDIGNPVKRREFPFDEKMRADCDEYYYKNYVRWYSTKPFSTANGQIPQINIWDDHDIIDGFGSYTDHFMKCAVFRGIGGVAHKYYLLFQHHITPPASTYTTDSKAAQKEDGVDRAQVKDTFVYKEPGEDPSYIIGTKPGPYVEQRSRSIYCQLGRRIAFASIDARTERTRHQINYPETYKLILDRVNKELSENKEIKHLILLLGVPIAYPRLQWLENILQSPIIGPIRFLNRRFGFAGGLFNKFDGGVDLLDDLDDHYTARQHKKERRELVHILQEIAKKNSVRVTILGGDVHLAAIGRFFSKSAHAIPAEHDWRYMPNIISSAITNKPPPTAVANLLAKRNKVHHLDHDTDETLLEIFNRDPGMGSDMTASTSTTTTKKTADSNHATMPSRNFAIIAENTDPMVAAAEASINGGTPITNGEAVTNGTNGTATNGSTTEGSSAPADPTMHKRTNPRQPMHKGEISAGTEHPAANGLTRTGLCGQFGLDVTLRVEISPSDRGGHTDGYGLSIPALDSSAYKEQGTQW